MINKNHRWNKDPLLSVADSHIVDYPTPKNLGYAWGFGAAAGICLVVQIITGIFLAMHYTPELNYAFLSVEHIMTDVQYGWIIRYVHSNGASAFFAIVYFHIFRGIYYGSYAKPRHKLWITGILIFFLMMATAFIGYVLPWGQMSFWGATVITNLFSAIPFVGSSIVEWLWGGFSVSNATLNRFFSLHYLLPFATVGIILAHLALLHKDGSSNPIGFNPKIDTMQFFPYYYVKDLVAFFIFIAFLCFLLYFFPNTLGHSDNYIPANPMSTPAHIVPEWYFLPFYAILRSIPSKLGGVIAMVSAILILALLPWVDRSPVHTPRYRPIFFCAYFVLVADFILLGWLGQMPVEDPYTDIGFVATVLYFYTLVVLIPMAKTIEIYGFKNFFSN
jgi:ubiquinol-cytochrome c reductase cytochrome b subunit